MNINRGPDFDFPYHPPESTPGDQKKNTQIPSTDEYAGKVKRIKPDEANSPANNKSFETDELAKKTLSTEAPFGGKKRERSDEDSSDIPEAEDILTLLPPELAANIVGKLPLKDQLAVSVTSQHLSQVSIRKIIDDDVQLMVEFTVFLVEQLKSIGKLTAEDEHRLVIPPDLKQKMLGPENRSLETHKEYSDLVLHHIVKVLEKVLPSLDEEECHKIYSISNNQLPLFFNNILAIAHVYSQMNARTITVSDSIGILLCCTRFSSNHGPPPSSDTQRRIGFYDTLKIIENLFAPDQKQEAFESLVNRSAYAPSIFSEKLLPPQYWHTEKGIHSSELGHDPKFFNERMEVVSKIADPDKRNILIADNYTYRGVVRLLSLNLEQAQNDFKIAIEAAGKITNPIQRDEVLSAISKFILKMGGNFDMAVNVARTISNTDVRNSTFAYLHILVGNLEIAIPFIDNIIDETLKNLLLKRLSLSFVETAKFSDAATQASKITDQDLRDDAFDWLENFEPLHNRLIRAIKNIFISQ